jgi:hypothetical protein
MGSSLLIPAAAATLLAILTVLWGQFKKTQRERMTVTWEQLVAQLAPVGHVGLEEVATDFLAPTSQLADPRCEDVRLAPRDIWDLVGGVDGIETMERNARVLVELAGYVQRWNQEAIVVAEQLRLDAQEIQTYLAKIRRAKKRGTLTTWFPIYAQRATAAYYLMTQRLLALYEVSHAGLFPALKAAL